LLGERQELQTPRRGREDPFGGERFARKGGQERHAGLRLESGRSARCVAGYVHLGGSMSPIFDFIATQPLDTIRATPTVICKRCHRLIATQMCVVCRDPICSFCWDTFGTCEHRGHDADREKRELAEL
jgi:hypothetical protein